MTLCLCTNSWWDLDTLKKGIFCCILPVECWVLLISLFALSQIRGVRSGWCVCEAAASFLDQGLNKLLSAQNRGKVCPSVRRDVWTGYMWTIVLFLPRSSKSYSSSLHRPHLEGEHCVVFSGGNSCPRGSLHQDVFLQRGPFHLQE